MLGDTSKQQVIQKFSFIESLNLSRGVDRGDREILNQLDLERALNSAIVTSSERSTTIDTKENRACSDTSSLSLHKIVPDSTSNPYSHRKSKNRNYLGKILFALACSYSLFALWWLFGDRASQILTTLTGGKHIIMPKSDVKFINYMERSLVAIERELEANKSDANGDSEVVYVPVYTPNSTPATFPQVSNGNLPLTPLSNNNAATNSQPEALKIPTPPPLPEPTPIPADNQPSTPEIAAVNTQPAIKHTLTGILDLGANKSAALIKINGQTRRFWLGEKIGNSDWILESVSDRAVAISYQGQVRHIAVGETF